MSAPREYLAVTPPGLEAVTEAELGELGVADARATEGGVAFSGPPEACWRVNLWSRTATRVLERVAELEAPTFAALERGVAGVDWAALLPSGAAVRVRAATHRARLSHAGHVERAVGRALERALGRPGEARGSAAPQTVLARIVGTRCVLSLDTSGELLHRRGWRPEGRGAPLRETLAAAVLRLSGYDPERPLVDPMCGSGTLPVEAALAALRVAPGRGRRFAFEQRPDFRREAWEALLREADGRRRTEPPAAIVGADRSADAAETARANAARAGVGEHVTLTAQPLSTLVPPPGGPGLVVCNPPWGVRLGTRGALRRVYAELGGVLADRFRGWRAAVLCTDRRLERELRVLVTGRVALRAGGQRVDLVLAAL